MRACRSHEPSRQGPKSLSEADVSRSIEPNGQVEPRASLKQFAQDFDEIATAQWEGKKINLTCVLPRKGNHIDSIDRGMGLVLT